MRAEEQTTLPAKASTYTSPWLEVAAESGDSTPLLKFTKGGKLVTPKSRKAPNTLPTSRKQCAVG
jgi:hypothetical protein